MRSRKAGFLGLAGLCVAVAAYAVIAYGFAPLGALVDPAMRANFAAHRAAVYTHVFAAAVALALGPFQFLPRFRAARPAWHRWAGRAYLGLGVGVGGLAGLSLAVHAYGGTVARAGFGVLAAAWLYTGFRAWRAIVRRDVAAHQRWMVRNFALTLAAVTLRLWLPLLLVAGWPMAQAYPLVAWLCWVPNLLLAEQCLQTGHAAPSATPS